MLPLFSRRVRVGGAVRLFDLVRVISVPPPFTGAVRCLSQAAPLPEVRDNIPEYHISTFPLSDAARRSLATNFGISTLYPIQALVFNAVHEGKDMIGKSRTGTGKTLAFVLPLAERLAAENFRAGRKQAAVLILEPTRELARQVAGEIEKFDRNLNIATLYGGSGYDVQIKAMERGVHFLIATPGRLLDHMRRGTVDLSELRSIVLDESDEMLRMGFQGDVDKIMAAVKGKVQMLLFSATVPTWIQQLSRKYCTDPEFVDVVGDETTMTPNTLTHKCIVGGTNKPALIGTLIKQNTTPTGRAIVFTKTKSEAEVIARSRDLGVSASVIHGDISQGGRDSALAAFRAGHPRVLVATDLAARGLDVPNVELVIHSEFPDEVERFVHRSGRTGRAGKPGVSIVIYQPSERGQIRELSRQIGVPIHAISTNRPDLNNPSVVIPKVKEMLRNPRVKMGAPAFAEVAKTLLESHPDLVNALLYQAYGSETDTRSDLTGTPGFVSVQLKGQNLDTRTVTNLLTTVLGRDASSSVGQVEVFNRRSEAVIDLRAEVAKELQELAYQSPEDENLAGFTFDEPLPRGLFEDARSYGSVMSNSQGQYKRAPPPRRATSGFGSGSSHGGRFGSGRHGRDGHRSRDGYGSRDNYRDNSSDNYRSSYGSGFGSNFGKRDTGRRVEFERVNIVRDANGVASARGDNRADTRSSPQQPSRDFDDFFTN